MANPVTLRLPKRPLYHHHLNSLAVTLMATMHAAELQLAVIVMVETRSRLLLQDIRSNSSSQARLLARDLLLLEVQNGVAVVVPARRRRAVNRLARLWLAPSLTDHP